ncbi:hypothetical protein OS493_022597 [Desmophyllum pertusum]|uniref:Uncharacterized protein n=1 Tax=Desmophyllum pertusum TaxID=174260 RepID=A0A9X0CQN9_9CNID|nr:hypothetical protein OS493_022597 [Desmophyllum pertusum]
MDNSRAEEVTEEPEKPIDEENLPQVEILEIVNNPVMDENASIASRKTVLNTNSFWSVRSQRLPALRLLEQLVEKKTTAEEIITSITLNIIRNCVFDQKTLFMQRDQPHICTLDPVYEDDR